MKKKFNKKPACVVCGKRTRRKGYPVLCRRHKQRK